MTEKTIASSSVKVDQAGQKADGQDEFKYSVFGNFMRGFGQHAIDDSINAITQMINHSPLKTHIPEVDLIAEPDKASWAGTIGGVAGDVSKFVAVGAVVGATAVADAPIAAVALTGAAAGLLTPQKEDNNKDFWTEKAKTVAVDTATFVTMGGAAKALTVAGPLASIGGRTLLQDVALGGLSGTAGGAVRAEVAAILDEGRLATTDELVSSAGRYAAFGAISAGAGHVVNNIADRMTRTVSNYFEYDKQGLLRKVPGDVDPFNLSYDKNGNLVKVTTGDVLDNGGFRTYTKGADGQWSVEAKYMTHTSFSTLPEGFTQQYKFLDPLYNHFTYRKVFDYTPFEIGADGRSMIFTQKIPNSNLGAGTFLFTEKDVVHYDWSGAVGPVTVSRPTKIK